jgi:hypothetical protein
MSLRELLRAFTQFGCNRILFKKLSPNDNSKNQVYLGGDFTTINVLPIGEISTVKTGGWKRERFRAAINLSWLSEDGTIHRAPDACLILYPKYPEVRLSGFLRGCSHPPSHLMSQRLDGRLLLLGITNEPSLIAYVLSGDNPNTEQILSLGSVESIGVFRIIPLIEDPSQNQSRSLLLEALRRIHEKGWIDSKRLDSTRSIRPCNSPNCGGYTLEAELGIIPNGFSEPDYLGWEVKQFSSSAITLFTPEPTGGFYRERGVREFVKKYGYKDKRGRPDRLNFGGIHKSGFENPLTGLTLRVVGYDRESSTITDPDGKIILVDKTGSIAASWDYPGLLSHWNRKHARAVYVPSRVMSGATRRYAYGNKVILCTGADFTRFLDQVCAGIIFYDPGIKFENVSGKGKSKKRSQFRIRIGSIPELYRSHEVFDILASG